MQRVENMIIPINPRDPQTDMRNWSKYGFRNRFVQMGEELKDYEYFGGDRAHHLNFLQQRLRSYPDVQLPAHTWKCYCDCEKLQHNCYVYNHDLQHIEVVGSCCIKRFEKRRLCRTCKTIHSGTKYDQCLNCRKDEKRREKEEKKRRVEDEKERARLLREEQEKQKRAEEERFKEIWRSGSIRDKLGTYHLPKLQRFAEQKGIMKVQNYDKDGLITTLLRFTRPQDLPFQ